MGYWKRQYTEKYCQPQGQDREDPAAWMFFNGQWALKVRGAPRLHPGDRLSAPRPGYPGEKRAVTVRAHLTQANSYDLYAVER